MKQRILFIGGIADGETRMLEDNVLLHPVCRSEGHSSYVRETIIGFDFKFDVMLDSETSVRQAMGMLIDRYENRLTRID